MFVSVLVVGHKILKNTYAKSSSITHRYRPIWVGMWFGELIHGPACIVSISTDFQRHILSTSLTSV